MEDHKQTQVEVDVNEEESEVQQPKQGKAADDDDKSERLAPGLDDAVNKVLGELDLQSPDMTERGVRKRVMDELGIEDLTKSEKYRIKVLLQHFIDEKSAELDEGSEEEASQSEPSDAADSDHLENDEELPKKRTNKRKLTKIPKKKGQKNAPGQPKRAITAFMYFSQARRSQVRDENPDFGFGEVAKLLGNLWRELSDDEKQPFLNKAAADKERFDKEMAEWRLSQPRSSEPENEEAMASQPSKKKPRKSRKVTSKEKVDETIGSSDSEDQEPKELSIFDRVMLSMKSSRRRKIELSTEEIETIAPDLIERMRIACEADENAYAQKKPATQKIKLLDEVEKEVRKQRMHEMLLDAGLLRRFRDWLQLLPDGSLPNLTLRTRIYALLEILPIDGDYLAESEGLGKILMSYWSNPQESVKNRHLLRALIEKWSRPMFRADTDYRKMHEHSEKNIAYVKSRLAKLKSSTDRPTIRYQSHHAERPAKAIFDYSVMPQSRILEVDEDSEPRHVGPTGDLSKMARIKKNIDRLQREKKLKSARTVLKSGRR